MKFTLSWLREHLETDATVDAIVDAMIRIGLEVEEVHDPAKTLAPFTVGYVEATAPHPDADRLRVCQVATRDGKLQIVCGAPNARQGIHVAYAAVGTYVPGIDVTLTKAKIRGVESHGMLCSSRELELGTDHDGIMELPAAEVGTPIAAVLGLNDPVIDFEVTPNRPDTNGVDGVARDLAAAGLGRLRTSPVSAVAGTFAQPVPVVIDDEVMCPAFASRLIRGVRNGPSPEWLAARLRAIGLRPISALVDVTNYLSYDRARPLHVYDAQKLTGTVRARPGQAGESFLGLDGKTYEVDASMCVIADDARVLGLGGIMGGAYSGCTDETTDVVIECALFDPIRTARTGRKTGIISDARYRFERGVDPEGLITGIEYATQLILAACGGTPSNVALTGAAPGPARRISFDPQHVARLSGLTLSDDRKADILRALGFEVTTGPVWQVTVPTFRPDIAGSADLVEEITRIHGLEHLPATPLDPITRAPGHVAAPLRNREADARRTLVGAGFSEAITWAFCDEAPARAFGSDAALRLANPIAAELCIMRPSPLPNLIAAARRNFDRGARVARIFEIGGGYVTAAPDGQRTMLVALFAGDAPAHWDKRGDAADAFAAKRLALHVLDSLSIPLNGLQTLVSAPDWYHPGQSGALALGPKQVLAHFGVLHPAALASLGAEGKMAAIEIDLGALPWQKGGRGTARPPLHLPTLMPVRRDFAFVIARTASAEALVRAVKGADKNLIDDVVVFDDYRGTGMAEDERSLAVEVTLQPREKTLTDAEIEAVSARIIEQAKRALGARLRS